MPPCVRKEKQKGGIYQFSNLVMDGVAPVVKVVVEYSRNTRVGEYIRISLAKI